jgi:hypothetical protein
VLSYVEAFVLFLLVNTHAHYKLDDVEYDEGGDECES